MDGPAGIEMSIDPPPLDTLESSGVVTPVIFVMAMMAPAATAMNTTAIMPNTNHGMPPETFVGEAPYCVPYGWAPYCWLS
jgi:hypothetical protein